jgi:hypothetical protein
VNRPDVVLAGLPRSGTTLTCHLLNRLPDTVALHEPIRGIFKSLTDRSAICASVDRFFRDTRESILTRGTAVSKHRDGQIPDNPVGDRDAASGLRQRAVVKGEIRIEKDLRPDFLLVIKHPAAFTALLEDLVPRFPCYAVIRNPLSVLASWNSVDMSVQSGHAPIAERLDGGLAYALGRVEDRLERQLHLLAWFYERFARTLPPTSIVRYEELIASGGRALSAITPRAAVLDEALYSRNSNEAYDRRAMRAIGDKLLKTEGAFWHFYAKEDVERLLDD